MESTVAYYGTIALCAVGSLAALAAALWLVLTRRRERAARAAADAAAAEEIDLPWTVRGETPPEKPPRRPQKSLVPAAVLAAGILTAALSGGCLFTGAVPSPWAEEIVLLEGDGETYASIRPELLPQSALGPEVDGAREEIRYAFENASDESGGNPGYWSRVFDTPEAAQEFLGVPLLESAALGRPEGAERVWRWTVFLEGRADGTIWRGGVNARGEKNGLTVNLVSYLHFREEQMEEGGGTITWPVEEEYSMANGCRAFLWSSAIYGGGEGTGLGACFTKDGVFYLVHILGYRTDPEQVRSAMYELLDGYE